MTLDVVDVELHLAGKVDLTAPADLPKTGDAGFDREPPSVREGIFGDFTRKWRTGTDKRHVSDKHIVKLRQFVEGKFAEPFAGVSNARIIFDFERDAFLMLIVLQQIFQPLLGIEAHGPKFIHFKFAAESANADLREENRAAIFNPHH